ncbi:OmpA family protein [Colwellia sp. 6_MG-2023]|uniref:OmpA family protein n=1 Tax=Colwellia sp. 6_MG-2023 TaxID=3062676 RepID=UPI0026E3D0FC|nr:OmpA family protein [Colwellia sp. 6_MG-2023]MDO6486284.1 OmpA family protein [Colwellia sp. 6_MG-2023]
MNKLQGLKAVLLSSPLLLTNAFAADKTPLAEDLVGKFYGGAHLLYIDTDDGRKLSDPLKASDPYATKGHGAGFGAEIGYRFTESVEARLSFSQINIDKDNSFYDKPYVADISALYFPEKESFYVVGGLGYLDIGQAKESVNLGVGYRHYLSENTAVYLEGKGHYEFSDHHQEGSARLGVIYFFGGSEKSMPERKKEPTMVDKAGAAVAGLVAAVKGNDDDNDGVLNDYDNCPDTPITDKVDRKGCTIFTEETNRMSLLVNFDNNKSTVKAEYLPEIKKMSDFLMAYPDVSLTIEGHTSKVGSAAYNKKISQQRADAIVDVLVNRFNIDSDRLSAVGFGEENLLDSGDNQEAHAKNRRIEAKVSVTEQVPVSR